MTSMRFPRANLSGDSAHQGDNDHRADGRRGGVSQPQAQAGQVVALRVAPAGESEAARAASLDSADGGEFGRPAWQDYFFLAPNVRFTRTPDTDLAKRATPQAEEAAQNKAPVREPARPAPPAPAATNSVRTIPVARAAAPAQAKPVIAPSAATPVAPAVPPQPTAAPAQKPRPSGLRWSYLSDHAFFEFGMPFLAERLARAHLNEAGPAPPA
ncbi:hypothetical protein EN753_20115, partial [Mesorhizobium sp. M2A.F.Ca.ET.029.05.1.1]